MKIGLYLFKTRKRDLKKDFSGQGWVELEEGIVGINGDGEN